MQNVTFQEGNPVFFHKHEDIQAFLKAYKAARENDWRNTLFHELIVAEDHLTYWEKAKLLKTKDGLTSWTKTKKALIANTPLAKALLYYNDHNKTLPLSLEMLVGLPILNTRLEDTLDSKYRRKTIRDRFFTSLFPPSERETLDRTVENLKLGIEQININMDVFRVVSRLPKVLVLLLKKSIHDHFSADLFPEANREALDASIRDLSQTSIQTVVSNLQAIATILGLREAVEALLKKLKLQESLRHIDTSTFMKGLERFERYSYYKRGLEKKVEIINTCHNASLLSLLLTAQHPNTTQKQRRAFSLRKINQLKEYCEYYEVQRRSYNAEILIYGVPLVIGYLVGLVVVGLTNSLFSLLSARPTHFSPDIIMPSLFVTLLASLTRSNIFKEIKGFDANIFEPVILAAAFIEGMKDHKAFSHQSQVKHISTILLALGHSFRACLLALVYSAAQARLDQLERIEHATKEIQVVEEYFLKGETQTTNHTVLESNEASCTPRA